MGRRREENVGRQASLRFAQIQIKAALLGRLFSLEKAWPFVHNWCTWIGEAIKEKAGRYKWAVYAPPGYNGNQNAIIIGFSPKKRHPISAR
jgi:hypothetical protein